MDIPAPVDVSKLKGILANSKKVMKVVEEKFPTTMPNTKMNEGYDNNSFHQDTFYDETDERELAYTTPVINTSKPKELEIRDYTKDDVINSKLPQNIKEAMLNKPIPKINPYSTGVSLEGLEDLIEKPKPRPIPQQRQISEQRINKDDVITISLEKLNELIDKRVNEKISELFTKTISEQAIKKTLTTLMTEGKLTTRKK